MLFRSAYISIQFARDRPRVAWHTSTHRPSSAPRVRARTLRPSSWSRPPAGRSSTARTTGLSLIRPRSSLALDAEQPTTFDHCVHSTGSPPAPGCPPRRAEPSIALPKPRQPDFSELSFARDQVRRATSLDRAGEPGVLTCSRIADGAAERNSTLGGRRYSALVSSAVLAPG